VRRSVIPRVLPPVLRRVTSWNASLDRREIEFEIGAQARAEAARFIGEVPDDASITGIDVSDPTLAHLTAAIEQCRRRVEREHRFVLLRPLTGLDVRGRRVFAWLVARLLGTPVAQNADGDRLMPVHARPGAKRIAEGARYHQTREGGAPHTDNVSLPDLFDYLVFSCIRPGWLGGESILISALAVHERLREFPSALNILRKPFWWEYRGISAGLFQAPIITYTEAGEPRFRFLRRYLESAHMRAGEPLTPEQVWALDVIDAILDDESLRFRLPMEEGHILVAYDSQVLHARTTFCDRLPGAPACVREALEAPWRYFDRVWVSRTSRSL